ncbi:TetR/AcrR family transcriptional regulator [Metabacillus idriensis]|uniref:TetR/AcrR family transcriptional regulator n=1 Tax=Metabacillus idriensis TaxID=324768 RepID=UPI00203D5B58|nr:TetR/AcrR family transcriptional regulator [Metabacillus idriensis]MCM3595547.1 TetR/AcrR family transcriptional regulator [Metabacillus idriensis]
MNGFERRKQTKMEQIQKAAFQLFSQYGINKVNIQEIAAAANVSQVTIYNYFGSKDALAIQVIKSFFQEQIDFYTDLFKMNIPFQKKMEKLVEQKIAHSKAIGPELLEYMMADEGEIKQIMTDFTVNQSMPLFKSFIESGKKEGHIRDELSFETIMFYFNMFASEVYKHPEFILDHKDRNKMTKEFLHLFFYGLTGK